MNMNDEKLLLETEIFVKEEKKFTLKILQNLKVIDSKKLFVELGYNSLFSYCKDHLKYSDQESAIRVNAMRLLRDIPSAQEKIEKGTLNLTNAGNLFSDMKKYEKESGKKLTHDEKKRLVSKVDGVSTRNARTIIHKELNLKQIEVDTNVEIKIKKKTMDRLDRLKEKLNIHDLDLLLNVLMKEKEDSLVKHHAKEKEPEVTFAPVSKVKKSTRYIPLKVKRALLKEANYRCQYLSSSGNRCDSHVFLTVEHSYPFAYGGGNDVSNLSILCFQHNQYKFLKFKNG